MLFSPSKGVSIVIWVMKQQSIQKCTPHFARHQYLYVYVIWYTTLTWFWNLHHFLKWQCKHKDAFTRATIPQVQSNLIAMMKIKKAAKRWYGVYVETSEENMITSVTLVLRNCSSDSTTCTLLLQSELQGMSPIPNWFFGISLGWQPARWYAAWTSWQTHSFFNVWHLHRTVTCEEWFHI